MQLHIQSLWRSIIFFGPSLSRTQRLGYHLRSPKKLSSVHFAPMTSLKGYCNLSNTGNSASPGLVDEKGDEVFYSKREQMLHGNLLFDLGKHEEKAFNSNPSDGRLMLIDGTSIIYRSYYKLLAKLHHGHLSHADGNGDWVLTIFTALSLIIDVLKFIPSHVAVVFDHDGVSFGQTSISSTESVKGKVSLIILVPSETCMPLPPMRCSFLIPLTFSLHFLLSLLLSLFTYGDAEY